MKFVSVAIKLNVCDSQLLSFLSNVSSDRGSRRAIRAGAFKLTFEVLEARRRRSKGLALAIIDQLAIDILVATADGEPRLLGRTLNIGTNASTPPKTPYQFCFTVFC